MMYARRSDLRTCVTFSGLEGLNRALTCHSRVRRFENPPVVETLDPILLGSGERIRPQIKYHDYGVVSVLMEFPFEGDWESLSTLAIFPVVFFFRPGR